MADNESMAAKRALSLSVFTRLRDMVRELEDNEKRLGQDFASGAIEFKLNPNEMAWYVAYKTDAASVA